MRWTNLVNSLQSDSKKDYSTKVEIIDGQEILVRVFTSKEPQRKPSVHVKSRKPRKSASSVKHPVM